MEEDCDCSICQSSEPDQACHTLQCGHSFHTECIVRWFRAGHSTCPNCRSEPTENNLIYPDVMTRASLLRRHYHRAPPELKQLIENVRKAEARYRDNSAREKEVYRENRLILKEYQTLVSKRRQSRHAIHRAKRRLGLFTSPSFPMPMITQNYRFW